ncbi:hypothetical protein PVAP13_2KG411310 [Panicum virgatum]|uniref:Uncharacterized protein n=1 Tax=Panicum virgatum TaxID=38727 RepID=A0A8T0WM30_PANVG|nr:hypothetical protein PVAP13_2KG411310 [Panicum virgatum]
MSWRRGRRLGARSNIPRQLLSPCRLSFSPRELSRCALLRHRRSPAASRPPRAGRAAASALPSHRPVRCPRPAAVLREHRGRRRQDTARLGGPAGRRSSGPGPAPPALCGRTSRRRTGVELNLHGLEEKENEHFLVNTGTVYFHQTGSFVVGGESF